MSSSATNTEGQIAIAKGAENIRALLINGDIGALESGSAISSFDALSAPWATLRPRTRHINGGLNLCLRERDYSPCVESGIDTSALDVDQRASLAVLRGHSTDCYRRLREDVCVEPPFSAEIDGKAATIGMCHGLNPLLDVNNNAAPIRADAAGKLVRWNYPISWDVLIPQRTIEHARKPLRTICAVCDFAKFGGVIEMRGKFGFVHFISPTPDYPRRGRFALLHPLICIIHTKQ